MATKALMDVAEYLHTSFDGPDCEYLNGEIIRLDGALRMPPR